MRSCSSPVGTLKVMASLAIVAGSDFGEVVAGCVEPGRGTPACVLVRLVASLFLLRWSERCRRRVEAGKQVEAAGYRPHSTIVEDFVYSAHKEVVEA